MVYLMGVINALERLRISEANLRLYTLPGQRVDHCGRKPKVFATAYLPSHCLLPGGRKVETMCSICALDSVQVGASKIAITCSAKYSTVAMNRH